jgi:hypothetical protein
VIEMETKQISKKAKKAGINEIAKACERMVNDVKGGLKHEL